MNIVLTGFMGSGKSAVGKEIAKIMKMEFVDTDDLIEKKTGLTIKEIFNSSGESEFRKIESEIIEEISNKDNCVIATGGGSVISEKNMKNFKKNGKIFYLKCSIEKILERTETEKDKRPLLKGNIKELIVKRREYYNVNDFEINGDNELPEVINSILSKCVINI